RVERTPSDQAGRAQLLVFDDPLPVKKVEVLAGPPGKMGAGRHFPAKRRRGCDGCHDRGIQDVRSRNTIHGEFHSTIVAHDGVPSTLSGPVSSEARPRRSPSWSTGDEALRSGCRLE